MELEHNLITSADYRLTSSDVKRILLSENILKYRKFIFSSYQAIASKLMTCLFRTMSRKRQKFLLLYRDGEDRIQEALDVRKIIQTHESVKMLKNMLLGKESRLLFRLQRGYLLEFGGSESEQSSICSDEISEMKDDEYMREEVARRLTGFTATTKFEKKLVLGVLHRRCWRNFEEAHDVAYEDSSDSISMSS